MARLRHLVVIVPGIGGSVLGDRYSLSPSGLYQVFTGPSQLTIDRELEPVGLVHDLTVLPPLLTLPGYQGLNLHLVNAFAGVRIETYRPPRPVSPDVDVLRVPYDFRRSVADAAQRLDTAVQEALVHRGSGSGDERPAIVLAHSMGGLVARYWIAVLGGWRHCRALIGLGVPFRGAPKALDWLVNGVRLGPLAFPGFTEVLRGWPSVYELLPQYDAVWDSASGTATQWTALPRALLDAQPGLAAYAPRYARLAAAAANVHDRIRTGWAALDERQVPAVIPYLTRGHATPNLAEFDGRRLLVTKEDPPWRGNVGWCGDGTVPALSAIPAELGELPERWRITVERHGPIGSIYAPIEDLRSFAKEPLPIRGDLKPLQPWLGLDLDDLAPAGYELPFTVTLLPAGLAGRSAWVTVTAVGARGGTGPAQLDAANTGPVGRVWRGVLAPLAPGRYEIDFEVMDVPGHGSVRAATTMVVLEPPAMAGPPNGVRAT